MRAFGLLAAGAVVGALLVLLGVWWGERDDPDTVMPTASMTPTASVVSTLPVVVTSLAAPSPVTSIVVITAPAVTRDAASTTVTNAPTTTLRISTTTTTTTTTRPVNVDENARRLFEGAGRGAQIETIASSADGIVSVDKVAFDEVRSDGSSVEFRFCENGNAEPEMVQSTISVGVSTVWRGESARADTAWAITRDLAPLWLGGVTSAGQILGRPDIGPGIGLEIFVDTNRYYSDGQTMSEVASQRISAAEWIGAAASVCQLS